MGPARRLAQAEGLVTASSRGRTILVSVLDPLPKACRSGRKGVVELFDADADVGVADVVEQGGELRFADVPGGSL